MASINSLTIENMREIAKERNGFCLSNEYINQSTKLKWKCNNGHIWESTWKYIRRGRWCPTCSRIKNKGKKRGDDSIHVMREIAEKRGGTCLSDTYVNTATKLIWKCKEGHTWSAIPNSIKNGSWCPICSKKNKLGKKRPKTTLDDMKKIAEERGGTCLSNAYINTKTKLKWKCKEGHIWSTTPNNIKSGTWCPTCSAKKGGQKKKIKMEKLHQIAKKNGGKCLAVEYILSTVKIPWQCKQGHIFETRPIEVLQGSWCPYCAGRHNHSIEEMHQIAKEHGGKCLSNSYKNVFTKLHWQCANGHEFYSIPKHVLNGHWCPNCTIYLNEQRCRYILEKLFDEKFIKDRSILNGYELDGYNSKLKLAFEYHGKQHYENVNFFYSRENMTLDDRIKRDKFKEELCKKTGIELLIIPYTIDPKEHISFITNELTNRGYKFKLNPNDITFDDFKLINHQLKEVQQIAESKGGKCLSTEYINVDTKMDFICEHGHKFSKTPYYLKLGQWCRICSYEKRGDLYRLDNNEMYRIAKDKGWECLTEKYINARTKITWKCTKGHIFERTLAHVKEGRGCPTCSKRK